ncbi:MAG: NAD kinase [Paludibacteraceae bacterium]|nr:NAD kinase [Paludibacteraceae bacterium]
MTVAIFGNTNKRCTIEEVQHILDFMREHDVRVFLSAELRNEMHIREEYPLFQSDADLSVDFAISIGGDGTFLTTAMQVGTLGIPILGINCGSLGFLADVKTDDVDHVLEQLLGGNYTIEDRTVLEVTSNKGLSVSPFALNEVAILKQELASMIAIEAQLDGEPLHDYHGDGLIISTPTGSTAYNLSAGGPIVMPQSRVTVLSPVASHSLNVRPLVVPDDRQLDLRVQSRTGAFLISIDGRSQRLTEEVQLHVQKAPFTIRLVRIDNHSFINALKTKLNWGV